MKRISILPRHDWQTKVEDVGLFFHTLDGKPYWDETCYYSFYSYEIDKLEDSTVELQSMCLQAVESVIRNKEYDKFCISPTAIPLIETSWNNDKDKTIYGRFDLSYDGTHEPKMLEYNADTPTTLLEASVAQWFWMKELFPDADQFNSIDEKLIDVFKKFAGDDTFYFSSMPNDEDYMTALYLQDAAQRAGLKTEYINLADIGWDSRRKVFTDMAENEIVNLFKLYPWENMMKDEFGKNVVLSTTRFFEPPWKMIMSNKMLLAKLWQMFPYHKNLLRTETTQFGNTYVRKPVYSREGCNVTIVKDGEVLTQSDGVYGDGQFIFQEFCPLPDFVGNYPVLGSWVVGNLSCGMGIREDSSLITRNMSRFVPHLFR